MARFEELSFDATHLSYASTRNYEPENLLSTGMHRPSFQYHEAHTTQGPLRWPDLWHHTNSDLPTITQLDFMDTTDDSPVIPISRRPSLLTPPRSGRCPRCYEDRSNGIQRQAANPPVDYTTLLPPLPDYGRLRGELPRRTNYRRP